MNWLCRVSIIIAGRCLIAYCGVRFDLSSFIPPLVVLQPTFSLSLSPMGLMRCRFKTTVQTPMVSSYLNPAMRTQVRRTRRQEDVRQRRAGALPEVGF
jgi:hypothetical protein